MTNLAYATDTISDNIVGSSSDIFPTVDATSSGKRLLDDRVEPLTAEEIVEMWSGFEESLRGWKEDTELLDEDEEYKPPTMRSIRRALQFVAYVKAQISSGIVYKPPRRVIPSGEGTVMFERRDEAAGERELIEIFDNEFEVSVYRYGKYVTGSTVSFSLVR